jgi:hypothetical protein
MTCGYAAFGRGESVPSTAGRTKGGCRMPTVAVLSVGNTAHGIVDLIILLGLVFLDFYAVTKTDHLLPALRYPA